MTNHKNIATRQETIKKILAASKTIAEPVVCTLGPRGRTVLLQNKYTGPYLTKDGVSIAGSINVADRLENQVVQLIKGCANKVVEKVGDGTTTSIVLVDAMLEEGFRLINAGYDPAGIKRGMDHAVKIISEDIRKKAVKITKHEELEQAGTISANGDSEVGKLCAMAIKEIGKDGTITVETSQNQEGLSFKKSSGFDLNAGLVSPYFITDLEEQKCTYEDCLVWLIQAPIVTGHEIQKMVPVMEYCISNNKPLLIFADSFDGDALNTLIKNKMDGRLKVVCVRTPAMERQFTYEDLAVVTGAKLRLATMDQFKDCSVSDLGQIKKVDITKNKTVMIAEKSGSYNTRLTDQAKKLVTMLDQESNEYMKIRLKNRLARLVSGVGVLTVGGRTELEIKEKKDRVDDALGSIRALQTLGYVDGAGLCYLKSRGILERLKMPSIDEQVGVSLLHKVLSAPIKQLLKNAGLDLESMGTVLAKSRNPKNSKGFNVKTLKMVDLVKEGIIDPALVTITALESAANIAGLLLTTDAIVMDPAVEAVD